MLIDTAQVKQSAAHRITANIFPDFPNMKSKLTAVTGIVNTKSTNSNIALGNPTWNIGAASASVNYTGSNGTSSVVATLYSDGELDITGTGNTVVFGDATSTSGTGAYQTP